MSEPSLAIPINDDIGIRAQAVFDDLGLDIVTAVNRFLEQIARREPICMSIVYPDDSNYDINLESITTGTPASLGGWEGLIVMSDDFNAPIDDFEEYL